MTECERLGDESNHDRTLKEEMVLLSETASDYQLFRQELNPNAAFRGQNCANTLTESSAIEYTVRSSRRLIDRSLASCRLEERSKNPIRKTPRMARAIRSTPHTFFSIRPTRHRRQNFFRGNRRDIRRNRYSEKPSRRQWERLERWRLDERHTELKTKVGSTLP